MEKLPADADSEAVTMPADDNNADNDNTEEEYITIHIVGSVANPGIYTIPEGSRVNDVVEKAGGPTEEAALERINLARPLFDGEQIFVPGADEGGDFSGFEGEGGGKVNINRASLDELTSLNGIGESRAQNIINYREDNGPFADIEDVMNVPNIAAGIFEGIKDDITVY